MNTCTDIHEINLDHGLLEADRHRLLTQPGTYRFLSGGLTMDVFLHLRPNSEAILHCGQSALPPTAARNLPIFHRISWVESFDCSFVAFNDPTLYLYDDLLCGWSQGTVGAFGIHEMNKVVAAISGLFPTPPKSVFYGSSAGGFWSMMMAALNDMQCVVEIPQTNMFTYPWAKHREALLNRCYRNHGLRPEDYRHRLDVSDWFEHIGKAPAGISYFQNAKDIQHTKLQLEPFREKMGAAGYDRLEVSFYERPDAEDGHTVMNRVDSVLAIRRALALT